MKVEAGDTVTISSMRLAPKSVFRIFANVSTTANDKTGITSCYLTLESSREGPQTYANIPDNITKSSGGIFCTYSTGKEPETMRLKCTSGSSIDVVVNQFYSI